MSERKIALFGGTFDPIHLGHTKVTRAAALYIGAEKIILIPARRSPLKNIPPEASDDDRLAMIKLATHGQDVFELSELELNRRPPSYTIDTVEHFSRLYGSNCSLYWLAGSDVVTELANWYRIADLMKLCSVCLMLRGGVPKPDLSQLRPFPGDSYIQKLRKNIIPTPVIDVSSTTIREAVAAGRDINGMVHPAVAEYIFSRGLYRPRSR